MSSRWSFLLPWQPSKRFSLATLLIFTTVVALAFAVPRLMVAGVAAIPFLLTGALVIKFGWRAEHHRLVVRPVALLCGAAMLAAGAWVLVTTWPR